VAVPAVSDRHAVVHLPRVAQDAEHPVVELFGLDEIATVDAEVIDHGHILACPADTAVQFNNDLRSAN
jgi:hypothetical protein